MRKNALREIM